MFTLKFGDIITEVIWFWDEKAYVWRPNHLDSIPGFFTHEAN